MSVIKKLLDNNLYFWLISLSFVLISYFSIYNSLILDNSNNFQIVEKIDSRIGLSILKQGLSSKYLLIPINFLKLFTFFVISQIISVYLFKLIYRIQYSSSYFICFIFLLGCSVYYFLIKLF